MADQFEMRMNLAAIKKTDPYAKEIIDSSAHCAFYTFNSIGNEWEKTDVEGAFFIYSRNAEPFQSIFINNRLNTNSFVEPITGQLELQPQRPFLLYRNERSRIRGFWFYNSAECDRIGEVIKKLIASSSEQKGQNVTNGGGSTVQAEGNSTVDIFSLLSKAQQNYQSSKNNNSTPTATPTPTAVNTPLKLEPNQSESVLNFFAAAKPATADVPFFQRLNSLNTVSVDQIEKQQRVTTPVSSNDHSCKPLTPIQISHSNVMVENDISVNLANKLRIQCSGPDVDNSPLAKFIGANNLGKPQLDLSNSKKPALMPPTMFAPTTPVREESNATTTSCLDKHPEPLTQSQFVQAITYLMRTDPGFVKKIHEAYLQSFTDMVSL